MHNKLGGDKSGTADPNWQKRCSIPYDTVLSNKTGQGVMVGQGCCCSWTGWAWVSWWWAAGVFLRCLFFLGFFFVVFCGVFFLLSLLFSFLFLFLLLLLLNHLYLNQQVSSLLPFWFSPSFQWVGEWASGCVGLSWFLRLNHYNQSCKCGQIT